VSLGQISPGSPSAPVIFALGVVTEPAIQYVSGSGAPQLRSSYFWSNFTSALEAVSFVLGDYVNAVSSADELDARLVTAAESIQGGGTNYPGLLALSLRQAMASMEITLGRDSNGNPDSSDVMAFQKDYDDGTCVIYSPSTHIYLVLDSCVAHRINTVHLLYSTMPMLLYLNPDLLAYSLLPILEFQSNSDSSWKFAYAAQSLGKFLPVHP
jgi:hypothetical protein